jgi:hypothetical protein
MTTIWVRPKGVQAPRPGTSLPVLLEQDLAGRAPFRRPCHGLRGRAGAAEAHRHGGGSRRRGAAGGGLPRRHVLGLEADAAIEVMQETFAVGCTGVYL